MPDVECSGAICVATLMSSVRCSMEHVVCNVMWNVVQWWRDVEWCDMKGGAIKILWGDVIECVASVKMFNVVWC